MSHVIKGSHVRRARPGGAANCGFTLAIILAFPFLATANAQAQSCREEITRLESNLRRNSTAGLTAPESVQATMHRQPTPNSVGAATAALEKRAGAALDHARKLAAEGKNEECLAALKTIDPEAE